MLSPHCLEPVADKFLPRNKIEAQGRKTVGVVLEAPFEMDQVVAIWQALPGKSLQILRSLEPSRRNGHGTSTIFDQTQMLKLILRDPWRLEQSLRDARPNFPASVSASQQVESGRLQNLSGGLPKRSQSMFPELLEYGLKPCFEAVKALSTKGRTLGIEQIQVGIYRKVIFDHPCAIVVWTMPL